MGGAVPWERSVLGPLLPPPAVLSVLPPLLLMLLAVLRAEASLCHCLPILWRRAMRPMSSLKPLLLPCADSLRCSLAASSSSDREEAAATLWLTAAVRLPASTALRGQQQRTWHVR